MRRRKITLLALLILAATAAITSAAPTPHELDGGALYPAPVEGATATTSPTATTGQSGTTGATAQTLATPATAATSGPTPLSPALTQTVPGTTAEILPDGYAAAPAGAPPAVQQAIWAANQLIGLPYIYGGGHASFEAAGYDCSGAVSYALHGGGLLDAPLDSTQLETWGLAGDGAWVTVYANAAHAFIEIAGIRLDTSTAGDPGGLPGPRWRPLLADTTGYVARSAAGF
jgi:cell wall-associated NlpC family hydrolase